MSKIQIGKLGARASGRSPKDLTYAAVAGKMSSEGQLRVPSFFVDERAMVGSWPILGNDRYGCCTVAAIVRIMLNNAVRRGKAIAISDADVVKAYLDMNNGADTGAMPVTALSYMRNVGINGYKVVAFARVNERDEYERKSAIQTFGHLYVAAGLPAKLDEDRDSRWELTPRESRTKADDARSLGGHAYPVFGFQRHEEFTVPWTEDVVEEKDWTDYYREEAWVFVDNQESDEYIVNTMLDQLAILRAT